MAALHKGQEKGPAFAGPGLPSTTNPYISRPPRWLRKGHTPPKNDERIFRSAIHLLRRIQDRATFPSFKKPNERPSKSKAEMAAQ
jgi:hypothetical protein